MIINSTNETFDPSKTLYFCMEPHMDKSPHFANFYNRMINDKNLMFCGTHEYHVNNTEWHLSLSYKQLSELNIPFKKYDKVLSVIVSNKNYDEGHKLRLNFIRYLDSCATLPFELHIYGSADLKFKNYKGALPPNKKDAGIFPYKYHFNAENNSIKNYITEKFTDSVLGECLTFYWGCPNIDDYYEKNCYIPLSLNQEDLESDIKTIKDAMDRDEWSIRRPIIQSMKKRILNEYNVFTRIKKILEISNSVVFVNINSSILSCLNEPVQSFISKLETNMKKCGFSKNIFVQLPDSSNKVNLFIEMLKNFIKCGENIIFIDYKENISFGDIYRKLWTNFKLGGNIIKLGSPVSESGLSGSGLEFLESSFYMSSIAVEKILQNIIQQNVNLDELKILNFIQEFL